MEAGLNGATKQEGMKALIICLWMKHWQDRRGSQYKHIIRY